MKSKRKLLTLLITIISYNITSQIKKENFKVSGTIDTYYTTNLFQSTKKTVGILTDKPANGFGLGMANLVFSYENKKTGVIIDLAYGPRANAANAFDGDINQLYVYYQPTADLKLTFGQFNTFFGYEVISPLVNFNYTVSYLFNAGPFSHTGLRADYTFNKDTSLMLALTNPHGITSGTNSLNDNYQFGFQFGYKYQYFNLVYGSDGFGFNDVLYLDYTGGFDFTNTFYLGINLAYSNSDDSNSSYKGAALYFQKEFSKLFSGGIRSEFFSNTSNNTQNDIYAITFTGNINLSDQLKLTSELRYDTSEDIIIIGNKKNVTGLTLAAIYNF